MTALPPERQAWYREAFAKSDDALAKTWAKVGSCFPERRREVTHDLAAGGGNAGDPGGWR